MDFLVLLVVLFAVSSLITATRRFKGNDSAQRAQDERNADAQRARNIAATQRTQAPKTMSQASNAPRELAQPRLTRMELSAPDTTRAALRHETFRPVAQPDASLFRHDDDLGGSMAYDSLEGMDPCHETQFSPITDGAIAAPSTDFISPARVFPAPLTRDALVQAVVMSEVLTRPADRGRNRRRRYGHV